MEVPLELRGVPRHVLEVRGKLLREALAVDSPHGETLPHAWPRCLPQEYVLRRIKQFSLTFAQQLLSPENSTLGIETVFAQTAALVTGASQQEGDQLVLRFAHKCK